MASIPFLRLSLIVLSLAIVATASSYSQPETNPCSIGWAQAPRVDPRSYYVSCFPEFGRMIGTITRPHFPGDAEEYGSTVYALGDVDGDSLADWIVTHRRADTSIGGVPKELLLYHGVRGSLPTVGSAQRIGPTELKSATIFKAIGDFDGNHYLDLVTAIYLGDTVGGNNGEYNTCYLVVFWGGPLGYSINDTSRLQCDAQMWLGLRGGIACDLDKDGADELMTWGQVGFSNGKPVPTPYVYVFKGHRGKRWGRQNTESTPAWRWWNPPQTDQGEITDIKVADQDGDGNPDLVLYENPDAGSNLTAQLSILYGKPGVDFPDTSTTNVQTIRFDRPDSTTLTGSFSMLSDISGDSIPELLVMDNDLRTLRIYIGLRGQRLLQQYGSGDEPEHPGDPVWWGKPWARISLPNKINPDSWAHPFNVLSDLGDANFDGVKDIWMVSPPFLICYASGWFLDHLIDGMADTRPGSNWSGSGITRLGDIDGSGIPAFTIGYDAGEHSYPEAFPGGVKFFKMTDSVLDLGPGEGRRYPPYTLRSTWANVHADGANTNAKPSAPLVIQAQPNPTTGEIHLSWTMPTVSGSVLTITNERGDEVERIELQSGITWTTWNSNTRPHGVYFATLRVGNRSAAAKIIVQ